MAPRIIYQSPPHPVNKRYMGWKITQDPAFSGNPNLVLFHRSNGRRTLLNRIAKWDPHSQVWATSRWMPKPPIVPQWLIDWVEANLKAQDRA